jgi:uncharacterized OB-fold protein
MFAARYWREVPQRYRMEAGKCAKCGKVFFPPRLVCDACKSREFETITLSDEGEIVSYTVIRTPPSGFEDEAPYAIGIVNLGGEVQLLTQIVDVDFEDLKIGGKVRVEFRRIQEDGKSGVLCYGYKCVPA